MGKRKYIEKPEKLWDWFEEYRSEVKSNPRIKIEYVGKNGERVETPIERPLTIEGFKCFCFKKGCDINRYWNNVDGKCNEYVTIVTRIKEEIRMEQLDGGLTGFYNSNLTARVAAIPDNQNISGNIKLLNNDPLDDSND